MSDTNDDEYRVATTFIKPGHENYDACRRFVFPIPRATQCGSL